MNKLRLSWTLLNLWERGETQKAIDFYLKAEMFKPTKEMEFGKSLHEKNETEMRTNKKTLPEFGGIVLNNPMPELKIEVSYSDTCDLVGVLDCLDVDTLLEFKTGKTPSSEYITSKQLGIYTLLLSFIKKDIKKILVVRFDGKDSEWSMRWVTPSIVDEAREYIDMLAPSIHNYFSKQNIL